MPVYCGTDLIRISRIDQAIERHGIHFLQRIFHETELTDCGWPDHLRLNSLAARFAAKEAVSKALGTGIGPAGVAWTDIRVSRQKAAPDGLSGQPVILLSGQALDRYHDLNGQSISISMSHDDDLAIAFCVISSPTERTETDCRMISSDAG